ncbi:helix-turn-helix domain-containing protein, partial [Paraburkholderia sp. SIMBA_049]
HPERLTLQQLSDAVHVSPFHLQRLFKRVVGVSPRQYQAAQRGAALREALQSGQPVTQAAVDAGSNSPSRLYASVPRELGMAPSAFRRQGAGLRIDYATASTPLGTVLVAATEQGICRIAFGD